jgi:hypothetical protein
MKANSIPIFRKPVPRAARIAILRSRCARTAGSSRHLRWALALVERLLRRILPLTMYPESLIFARGARTWILRRQLWLLQREPMRQIAAILTPERRGIQLGDSARGQNGTSPTLGSGSRLSQHAVPAVSLARRRVPLVHRFLPTSLAREDSGSRSEVARPFAARSAAADVYRYLPRTVSSRGGVLGPRRRGVAEIAVEDGIPARVPRQYRRVEDQALARSLASAEKRTPPAPSDARVAFAIPRPPLRREMNRSASSPERKDPAMQPEMNVAQITDAVLKQLDRRLVAARERMGRI